MKKKYFSFLVLAFTTLFFWGCTPEDTYVVVKASELQKAANGGLGTAQIEMVFAIQSDDDPNLPEKIKRAALPFLGNGGEIVIEKTEKHRITDGDSLRDEQPEVKLDKAKMIGRFNIPVGTENALLQAPRSIMWLRYRPHDKTFHLVPGNAVADLNHALNNINAMVEFEYDGGYCSGFEGEGTTIKILNDATINVGVAAVKVNNNPVLSGTQSTANGTLKISYNNDFYKNLAPCFFFGDMPNLKSESLGNDDTF